MSPAVRGAPSPRKDQEYPPEVLTPDEVRRLLAQFSRRYPTPVRNRALVTLLYRSGLRISEALALRPSDVDMDSHSLRLLDTKSGKPQTRGFHPSADVALIRWMDARKKLGVGNGGKKLFCTLAGEPLSGDYVRKMVHRAAGKAGVDKRVTPHSFRHTFAGEMEAQGVPVTTISKLLGHSGIQVTANYLDHLTNHQAVSALSEVALPPLADEDVISAAVAAQPQAVAAELTELRRRLAELENASQDQMTGSTLALAAEMARSQARKAREDAREARLEAKRARLDAAQEILAEWADAQAGDGEGTPLVLALPVEVLRLTARALNCLKREGIDTVGELVARSEQDLLDIRSMGTWSVREIREKLAAHGLALADSAGPRAPDS